MDNLTPWCEGERLISVKNDAHMGTITIEELAELVVMTMDAVVITDNAIKNMMGAK